MHEFSALEDADAVAHLLDLGEHVRREQHRLAALAARSQSRPSSSSRMVGSSVLVGSSRMTSGTARHEHRQERDLPLHAGGQLRERAGEVDVESPGQASTSPSTVTPRSRAEKVDELPAGHVLVKPQFAGQIGDLRRAATLSPSNRGRRWRPCRPSAAGSPSSMRRAVDLPEPFGPSRPNISPGAIRKVRRVEGTEAAVVLGEAPRSPRADCCACRWGHTMMIDWTVGICPHAEFAMADAFILSAARTPIGKFLGGLGRSLRARSSGQSLCARR